MKAPAFAYAKPRTLEEAFDLIERPGAKVLAGGQSLIPALNMRVAQPELLVDITGLPGLSEIRLDRGVLRVGGLVTHTQLQLSEDVRTHVPLLAQAVEHVAHPAIRNRGTLGGSVALADPAAEYPACLVALDATVVVHGRSDERLVGASEFFKGLYETDLRAGEIVAAVEFPALKKDERSVFLELARRHGDYAIIGLAAHWGQDRRFVYFGAGVKPVFAARASAARSLEEAKDVLKDDLDPPADLYNSSTTKRHLAGVLLERAWNTLSKPH
ncbi:MAG TPA: xanthine dehydrogenase family protein subunit M [Burkholderiales bacterium]|nr:xanthine dehydrogenase family protein subunit M [Burkholderiales bacterium]